jgi:transcriptional regulator CtsR
MKDFGEQLNEKDNLELKSNLRQIFFEHLPSQLEYKLSSDFTTIRKPEYHLH